MANPWLKKNPFLSMWLNGANWMVGTMRAAATTQAKRQIHTAVTKATNDNLKVLFNVNVPAAPKAKPKRRRR